MKKIFLLFAALGLTTFHSFAQTTVLQENFTNYLGTSATVPAGWNFSYNGYYSSSTYCGTSGPNAYKFGATGATITTPAFSNADTVKFWLKGSSTDSISYITVGESVDNVTWTKIATIKPVPTSGTTFKMHVHSSSTRLRFSYTKSAGNVAFDDLLIQKNISASTSSGLIKIYFNHPVNTSVSTGTNAIYLNQTLDDTLIAYINRAKYSIDVAVFNYVQSSGISNIATAINIAYNKGIKIRWIYNGGSTNPGLSLLNAGIKKLGSPTSAGYNIMHNKFMILDAKSAYAGDPFVWTGSANWDAEQFNADVNNAVIIQDKNLALAYTTEFEEMWGDTGLTPNSTNSKFGPYKTNNTPHSFSIGGKSVEQYFSPSDQTNSHILNAISSANSELYFGVYTFTESADADSIKAKINKGVSVAGIIDQFSQTSTPYSTLSPVMGNNLKVYTQTNSIYHNKFLIADACNSGSNPLVETGSHNWTITADTKNDENTLIIHDATIANIYYQSFSKNFTDLGGTTINCPALKTTGITGEENYEDKIIVYPNPNDGKFMVRITNQYRFTDLAYRQAGCEIKIYNVLGAVVYKSKITNEKSDIDLSTQPKGIYLLRVNDGNIFFERKVIIE